jgi:hypothetical protein
MKPMRVIVTASRDFHDRETVWGALDLIAGAARVEGRRLIVAHGRAPGGDTLADRWVMDRARLGWPVEAERHSAEWRRYGSYAGPKRNAEKLVAPGADACLAFVNACRKPTCEEPKPHGSHGATGCADLAEGEGIPTQRIERWSDSPPETE